MSSVLEELKSSARDSIEAKQRMIEELIELQQEHEQLWNLFPDVLLDASSYARSVYQLTVAEARARLYDRAFRELKEHMRALELRLLN